MYRGSMSAGKGDAARSCISSASTSAPIALARLYISYSSSDRCTACRTVDQAGILSLCSQMLRRLLPFASSSQTPSIFFRDNLPAITCS